MKKIGVFMADGCEEIEALTVVDIARRAGIETAMISVSGKKEVTSSHNVTFATDIPAEFMDYDLLDAIVLPGGMPGTLNLGVHEGVVSQVKSFVASGKLTAAICAAPSVLAKAGVLNGKTATVYPGCEVDVEGVCWSTETVVTTGNIITGKGPGVAALFALAVVAYLTGDAVAEGVRAGLMMA